MKQIIISLLLLACQSLSAQHILNYEANAPHVGDRLKPLHEELPINQKPVPLIDQDPNWHPNDLNRVSKAHFSAQGLEHGYTGNLGVVNEMNIDNSNSGYLRFMDGNNEKERIRIINGNFK